MFRRDAPLLMNPKPSWHKDSWMGKFVRNISNCRPRTIDTTRLAVEARKHLFAIAEREDVAFDLERRGILHIYHDKAGSTLAHGSTRCCRKAGWITML